MATKSVFTGPAPGDRTARRLIQEINRTVDLFMNDHEKAVGSDDQRLIQHVNQMLITIEQTANELRSMTNPPPQSQGRITDALARADNVLSQYDTIQPQIRPEESVANRNENDQQVDPPPLDEDLNKCII